jgi:hypothetical protein
MEIRSNPAPMNLALPPSILRLNPPQVLLQLWVSMSSSPPHAAAPAMTKTESRTPQSTLSGDLGHDPLTVGAPLELPHVRNEVKGSRHPTEQSHTNSSAPSHKTPLSSQPQSVILPWSLDKSNSRTQGYEGAGRGAKRAAEGLTSDMERKEKKVSKEPESHQEDPATDTSRAPTS